MPAENLSLTELERRVLGHVDSHDDDAKTRDTLEGLTRGLIADRYCLHVTSQDDTELVSDTLDELEARGLVSSKGGKLKRTAAGLKALQA